MTTPRFADETAALMPSPFVLPVEFRALFDGVKAHVTGMT